MKKYSDKELQQLKNLLKECQKFVQIMYEGAARCNLDSHSDTAYHDGKELLIRIDSAIGEN